MCQPAAAGLERQISAESDGINSARNEIARDCSADRQVQEMDNTMANTILASFRKQRQSKPHRFLEQSTVCSQKVPQPSRHRHSKLLHPVQCDATWRRHGLRLTSGTYQRAAGRWT